MAKTNPIEFFNQVRTETRKIVWPSRRETIMTGVMVIILTSFLGIFFMIVDSGFDALVNFLLGLAK